MKVSEYLNKIATENERITEAAFESLGFDSTKLDKLKAHRRIPGPHDRPDYHFSRKSENILCEVKTLHSAYHDGNIGHISMTIPHRIEDSGVFEIRKDKAETKIRGSLDRAVYQRKILCSQNGKFENYPFLVALFFDFFADDFLSITEIISDYPEISATIKAHKNCHFSAELEKFSVTEMELIFDGKKEVDLPELDTDHHWHFVLNPDARIPFAPEILGICEYDLFFHH